MRAGGSVAVFGATGGTALRGAGAGVRGAAHPDRVRAKGRDPKGEPMVLGGIAVGREQAREHPLGRQARAEIVADSVVTGGAVRDGAQIAVTTLQWCPCWT